MRYPNCCVGEPTNGLRKAVILPSLIESGRQVKGEIAGKDSTICIYSNTHSSRWICIIAGAADLLAICIEGKVRTDHHHIYSHGRMGISEGSTLYLSWSAGNIIIDISTPGAIWMDEESVDTLLISRLIAEVDTEIGVGRAGLLQLRLNDIV